MKRIKIEHAFAGQYEMFDADDLNRQSYLIQSDWEFPSIAAHFGWQPCHDSTDGTVDCRVCGKKNSQLIFSASKFIDTKIGEVVEIDEEYFDAYFKG